MLSRQLGAQLRRPTGLLGELIGRALVVVNFPINYWTVGLMDIQPSDHVLEVGFGSGVATRRIADIAVDGFVAGVDHSEAMVRQARMRNTSPIRDGRVELRQGDASALPYDDESFDKACAIQGIYFWSDPAPVLTELRRVLKPGGLLAISVFPKERMQRWWFTHGEYTLYTGEEIDKMLTQAGFRQTRLEVKRSWPQRLCALAIK